MLWIEFLNPIFGNKRKGKESKQNNIYGMETMHVASWKVLTLFIKYKEDMEPTLGLKR